MAAEPLRFALGDTVWTRALFDGSVGVADFPVELAKDVSLIDRLYGVRRGKFAGGDPAITDCILDRANRTADAPAIILPVFLISGFRHRTLLMRRHGPGPEALAGRVVCVPRILTPGSVWIRGLLADEFRIPREAIRWATVHGAENDAAWPYVYKRFDYPEGLEGVRAATQMLEAGDIDALVHPGVHEAHSLFGDDPMIQPTLARHPELWSPLGDPDAIADYYRRSGVYPLVHALAVQERVARDNPGLVDALVDAFQRARERAPTYMTPVERELEERQQQLLGVDPTEYWLGPGQRRALETVIRYLQEDGLIDRAPSLEELFPYHARE
jgi:4,5-dihydroxyphthalate decarboxylase